MGTAVTPLRPVVACVKWVDLRPEIDPLHGHIVPSERGGGFSPADHAAVEVALRLAEEWGTSATLLCAGPAAADDGLRELAASGAGAAVRIDQSAGLPSAVTADVLAPVLGPNDLDAQAVVCGDVSYDRGSGSVPALLAHHLQFAQALGLIDVTPWPDSRLQAVRRLDGARRERLAVTAPAVVSVEGSVAVLRRAPLTATLSGTRAATVEVRGGRIEYHVEPPRQRPWRPRARVLAAPVGDTALERIVHLADALVDRTPPRTVEADPPEAARLILEQLAQWGYLGEPSGGDGSS